MLNNKIPFARPIWNFETGQPIDLSRNISVSKALQMGCRYLLFIDSDTLFPANGIQDLVNARVPIISGVYRARGPPHNVIANRNGIPITMEEVNQAAQSPNPLISVDDVGAGACLIDCRVFKTVGQTLNEFRCVKNHRGQLPGGKEYYVTDYKTAVENNFRCAFCAGLILARFYWSRLGLMNTDALSEDYWAAKIFKQHGFNIFVHSRVFCNHESQFTEVGREGLMTSLRSAGEIN